LDSTGQLTALVSATFEQGELLSVATWLKIAVFGKLSK